MASEKLGMVPLHQHIHTTLNPQPQLVFPAAFAHPKSAATTRQLTSGFLDHRHFYDPHQATQFQHPWNANSRGGSREIDSDDDDDDDLEDEGVDEDGNNVCNIAKSVDGISNNQKMKQIAPFGELLSKLGL